MDRIQTLGWTANQCKYVYIGNYYTIFKCLYFDEQKEVKDFIIYLNWYVLIYLFQDNTSNKRKFV